MPWSKLESNLPRHRKTIRLAKALGISRAQAVGHIACLWCAAMDMNPDGDISDWSDEEIAEYSRWDGDVTVMARCLTECELVDDDGILHNWMRYQGSYRHAHNVRKWRAQKQKRKRKG